ncbi:MAG: hypothetical protein CBC83_07015 [Flavobacteriales bacterium TMED123]|nr:MAG: hypothetical protein CBC83_07015 [Flavobacteriales bacterium TMED123]|tara:strand:- start:271 stop:612 length:342 start_codon:yes stop_codon:yes gene_type:complete
MSSPKQDPRAADLPEGGEVIAHIPDEEAALRAFAKRIAEVPEGEPIPNEVIQEGLTAMVRLYSVKFQLGERWEPFSEGDMVPATAAMIMCTTMLKAVNVEVFELGMWQSWSGA